MNAPKSCIQRQLLAGAQLLTYKPPSVDTILLLHNHSAVLILTFFCNCVIFVKIVVRIRFMAAEEVT